MNLTRDQLKCKRKRRRWININREEIICIYNDITNNKNKLLNNLIRDDIYKELSSELTTNIEEIINNSLRMLEDIKYGDK